LRKYGGLWELSVDGIGVSRVEASAHLSNYVRLLHAFKTVFLAQISWERAQAEVEQAFAQKLKLLRAAEREPSGEAKNELREEALNTFVKDRLLALFHRTSSITITTNEMIRLIDVQGLGISEELIKVFMDPPVPGGGASLTTEEMVARIATLEMDFEQALEEKQDIRDTLVTRVSDMMIAQQDAAVLQSTLAPWALQARQAKERRHEEAVGHLQAAVEEERLSHQASKVAFAKIEAAHVEARAELQKTLEAVQADLVVVTEKFEERKRAAEQVARELLDTKKKGKATIKTLSTQVEGLTMRNRDLEEDLAASRAQCASLEVALAEEQQRGADLRKAMKEAEERHKQEVQDLWDGIITDLKRDLEASRGREVALHFVKERVGMDAEDRVAATQRSWVALAAEVAERRHKQKLIEEAHAETQRQLEVEQQALATSRAEFVDLAEKKREQRERFTMELEEFDQRLKWERASNERKFFMLEAQLDEKVKTAPFLSELLPIPVGLTSGAPVCSACHGLCRTYAKQGKLPGSPPRPAPQAGGADAPPAPAAEPPELPLMHCGGGRRARSRGGAGVGVRRRISAIVAWRQDHVRAVRGF